MSRKITAFMVAAVLAFAMSNAFAAGAVLRAIVVKTDNVSAYLQEVEKGKAMSKKLGVSVIIRAWRATYAGPQTGTIVVSLEYPSWTAFAEAHSKTTADKQFSEWLAGLDKIRTIVSDSIYREL